MHIVIRSIILLLVMSILVACGGGGGGGSSSSSGGSGGTPAPVETDTLSLSQGAITFSVTQYEAAPSPVTVTATITGSNTAGIVFGTLPGVESLPSWLSVELGDLVNNRVDAVFNIITTDLPAGTYPFTVRAVTFDANEQALDTADIALTYEVAEGVPISVSPKSVDVEMHYASDPISQVMSVTAGNYDWAASSSEANFDISEGTGSQDVTLSILPVQQSQVDENGQFQGGVNVLQNGTSNSDFFTINYMMFPTLENFGDEILLNAVARNSDGGEAGVNLRGTGLDWSASSDQLWLTFSASSGTITTEDDVSDSPEGDDFLVKVDASTLEEGRHEALITVTANADQTLEIPVTVEVAAQKLQPTQLGVALSQTANTAKLQSAIDINTNTNRIANWAASSNMAWLEVTASGTVMNDLIITADPTMLLDETFSEAIVTLTSPDPEITTTETIRVGFYKSAMSPLDTVLTLGNFSLTDFSIASDPIRPFAYIYSGEEFTDVRELSVLNIYTGLVENTINTASRVLNLTVSDDGAFLYLIRGSDGQGFVDVVDLDTQSIVDTWIYSAPSNSSSFPTNVTFARISNNPYIFISDGVIIDAENGEFLSLARGVGPRELDFKTDRFCNLGDGGTIFESEISCFKFVSAGFDGARITTENLGQATVSRGPTAWTKDGSRIFVIAERTLMLLDGSDLSVLETVSTPPEDFIEDYALDSNNNLYVTYRNDGEVPTDPLDPLVDGKRFVSIYDKDLVLLRTVDYPSDGSGFVPTFRDSALSGDDQRLIYLTNDETSEAVSFSVN